jgi:hypothetical protein
MMDVAPIIKNVFKKGNGIVSSSLLPDFIGLILLVRNNAAQY